MTSLDELRAVLLAGLEELAEALLGPPSLRKPRTWRWGSKGSLSLELQGRKRGSWHDHESGQGGGPFHLVQHARSCSMADAIDWSRNWAGLPESERRTTAAPERNRTSGADAEEAADQIRRITAARSLWARSTPITGTVAARYLTNTRAIPAPSMGWSDAVRFHAPTCSLILVATDATGAVQAVQRVHLTLDGRKAVWASRKTAESAFARAASGQMPSNPYRRIPIRECRHLDRVDYQRAGARMSRAVAVFDRALIPDPVAVLAEKLGPLAWATVPSSLDPHGAAPEVLGGYGDRLAPVALFPATETCASVSGLWTIRRHGLPPSEVMELAGMVPEPIDWTDHQEGKSDDRHSPAIAEAWPPTACGNRAR